MIYGYTRGSNGTIDQKNQTTKILQCKEACNNDIELVEDTVTSGKPYEQRGICALVSKLKKGDTLIVAELSRMARNTEEVLRIGREVVDKGASLLVLNPRIDFDGGLSSDILLTVLGLASNIERYYIRSRTRISFEQKKKDIKRQGFFISKAGKKVRQLGTPLGSVKKLKLEDKLDEVHNLIRKGVSQSAVSKILDVSRHTVSRLLKRFPLPQ